MRVERRSRPGNLSYLPAETYLSSRPINVPGPRLLFFPLRDIRPRFKILHHVLLLASISSLLFAFPSLSLPPTPLLHLLVDISSFSPPYLRPLSSSVRWSFPFFSFLNDVALGYDIPFLLQSAHHFSTWQGNAHRLSHQRMGTRRTRSPWWTLRVPATISGIFVILVRPFRDCDDQCETCAETASCVLSFIHRGYFATVRFVLQRISPESLSGAGVAINIFRHFSGEIFAQSVFLSRIFKWPHYAFKEKSGFSEVHLSIWRNMTRLHISRVAFYYFSILQKNCFISFSSLVIFLLVSILTIFSFFTQCNLPASRRQSEKE